MTGTWPDSERVDPWKGPCRPLVALVAPGGGDELRAELDRQGLGRIEVRETGFVDPGQCILMNPELINEAFDRTVFDAPGPHG